MIRYFDNCATTKVDEDVLDILNRYHTEKYYNPSARSTFSLEVANDIATAREKIAKSLGAGSASEILITSGGTEANNLAIDGSLRSKHGNIVVTAAEHSAVFNTVSELSNRGYELRQSKVLSDGRIDVDDFLSKIDNDTLLACFMHVNNETGAINDVRIINSLVKSKNPNTATFSDGVQAVGKIPVNLRYLGVDLYSFAGHKIHCTKGIGGLYVKSGSKLSPILFGGGQERGLRSGTEYVGGIVALAHSVSKAVAAVNDNATEFLEYKDTIRQSLITVPQWRENCTENSSPAIMSLAFAGIRGEVLLHMLEKYDIIVGTGSACSSKNKQSRIAKAIGLNPDYSEGILRISFSKYNTKDDVKFLAEKLAECVTELRKIVR
ncbi:MAG: cysteine desulfurase [Clostridiales bacterium]|nr:cysteine desulfurase [Clostridiales bacterium]